jgi:hypothetical protein
MQTYRSTANKTIVCNISICCIEAGACREAFNTVYIYGLHTRIVTKFLFVFWTIHNKWKSKCITQVGIHSFAAGQRLLYFWPSAVMLHWSCSKQIRCVLRIVQMLLFLGTVFEEHIVIIEVISSTNTASHTSINLLDTASFNIINTTLHLRHN